MSLYTKQKQATEIENRLGCQVGGWKERDGLGFHCCQMQTITLGNDKQQGPAAYNWELHPTSWYRP